MTWVLEGKQNSCYTKVMKNKTNTNTHEASQTQTPRRAKSIAVNPGRFWQHEHLLRRFHFGKLTCLFVQIENQRRNVVGWYLQIPVARNPLPQSNNCTVTAFVEFQL